ncbi:Methyltransferase-like protein 7A [Chionoecetes opilio]|uniref:Methyltransferase-like protein 7A n=1 Tax=Chionoecetes opilio TaxID=41210 RepID=A0A8J5CLJ4_CHIOP|nr:Methyltransferase-like protein 7A [Chionoecetes opilio]
MGIPDEEASEEACGCLYLVLGVLSAVWLVYKIANATQSRWFAWVMHFCTKDIFPALEEIKKEHFAPCQPLSPTTRNYARITPSESWKSELAQVCVNFAHYPAGSRLVVVDPNPHFKSYFDDNIKNFSHIQAEEFIVTTGDEMSAVSDGSVDVVVETLVLCSLASDKVEATLKEIQRVLVPGGKFYFMEHIAEFDLKKYRWRRRLQDVLTYWIPVWPFIFDGCCLDRETLPAIQQAGFSSVQAQKYYAPVPNILFDPERPNLKGVATN